MKYRLIYFLEKVVGKILSRILGCFISEQYKDESVKKGNIDQIVFVKFIEQGAWVLHIPTILYAQEILGPENVLICTFESNRDFIKTLDFIEEKQVIYIQDHALFSFVVSYLFQAFKIRTRRRVGASIDLEFLSSSSVIFSVLAGVKYRVGYVDDLHVQPRDKLVNLSLPYDPKTHVSHSGKELLKLLWPIDEKRLKGLYHSYKLAFSDELTVSRILDDSLNKEENASHLKIIIHPNFIDALPLRSWPLKNYADLIHKIQEEYKDAVILLTGRADEHATATKFIENYSLSGVHNLCGKTNWEDLFTLYNWTDVLICSDSGPAHFASLLDLNTIVMFGPETPNLYRPLGENVEVLYKNLACSPCFNVRNQRMSPCQNNLCMQEITVEDVIIKMEVLLTKEKSGRVKG